MQIIFSFWSFEISEGILNNLKIMISLDTFSNQGLNIFGPLWLILVFVSTTLLKVANYSNSLWLHVAKFKVSPMRLK